MRAHARLLTLSPTQEIVVAAPAPGVVTRFDLAVGQVIKTAKAGTSPPAASIADLSSVWLVAEIDESDARPCGRVNPSKSFQPRSLERFIRARY